MTNINEPEDSEAIQIGQLYIDMKNEFKNEFSTKVDEIREAGKEKAYEGTYPAVHCQSLFSLHVCVLFRITITSKIGQR